MAKACNLEPCKELYNERHPMHLWNLKILSLSLLALFLPWRALWYFTNAMALVITTTIWQLMSADQCDHCFIILLIVGELYVIFALVLVIFLIRCGHRAANDLPFYTWQRPNLAEAVLYIANGIWLAVICLLVLGGMFENSDQFGLAHMSALCVAAIFLIFVPVGPVFRIIGITACLGIIGLTGLSAMFGIYVRQNAREAAQDHRYCIYLPPQNRFVDNNRALSFLTLPKSQWQAHAILIIEADDGTRYGNWSYHQKRFMVPWDLHTPRPDLQCPH